MTDKVTKVIDLNSYPDFDDLNSREKARARSEVGNFVKESILDYVGEGSSPVQNGQWKRSLSKDYKKKKLKVSGVGFANMELKGKMLDALKWKKSGVDAVEVGIWKKSETPKAENHNLGITLPVRQFIPLSDGKFKGRIEKGIKEIIKDIHGESNDQ